MVYQDLVDRVPELEGALAKGPKAVRLVIKGKLEDVVPYHS